MTNKLILSLLLLLTSITITKTAWSDSEQSDANDPLIFHAIYSEKLRKIMHQLSQSVYDKKLDISESKKIRIENRQELFDNASELYITAKNLTQALPGFDLSIDEKNTFEGLARQLQIEANNLGYMTEVDDTEGMEAVFQRLNNTCNACHELFRF